MSTNPPVSQALESFLKRVPINYAEDLTSRFSVEMETQINVDSSHPHAEPVAEYRNTWQICSEEYGTYQFHHIRIPKNAMSEPYYHDPPIQYPLAPHIECCGMTGWNWKQKRSVWVAFDIDSITGHAAGVGIDEQAMVAVRKAACEIPWVQVRRSTGGGGLHFYVYFDPEDQPETENHTVHAGLARCVLGLMERETGFDFRGNMDVLGGNMWIWHRKISDKNRGLELIKDFEAFCPPLPINWRDNIDVIEGKSSKVRVRGVADQDYDSFESQASGRAKVDIDETHKQIESRIEGLDYSIMWVPDHHCWQTHTKAFEDLHENYPEEYTGIFRTLSEGKDKGKPNCFAFPLPGGGIRVTRFGRGAKEHETWNQDGGDWTWTYFNRAPSLREAASIYGGAEDPDGKGWVFTNFGDVKSVVKALGDQLQLDDSWLEIFGDVEGRNIVLRPNKQEQLVVEMDKKKEDKTPKGWIEKGRKFTRLIRTSTQPVTDDDDSNLDDRVRALVDTSNEFAQWVIFNEDGEWIGQNKDNVRSALRIWSADNAEDVLGQLVIKNWQIVNVPFQPEYLGNRRWNRDAPQYAVSPAESGTPHPHWDMILQHCGQDLDEVTKTHTWCRDNGIHSGADYLLYWLAFMFRNPYYKLPYLFFYGPQNSGKSILHEAVSLLMTRGVQLADEALKSSGNFNGELLNAVLCVVEETNLSTKNTQAYNRIKAWSMGQDILIHQKGKQACTLKNTTHWIQCANDKSYVPIFPGDTRITMMYVPMPDNAEVPKDLLLNNLREEAPAFLRALLDLKLPPPHSRTAIPILATESKKEAEQSVEGLVQKFIFAKCHHAPGAIMKLSDFYTEMVKWMGEDQSYIWTKAKIADEFRTRDFSPFVFGRSFNNVASIGNVSFSLKDKERDLGPPWIRKRQKLVQDFPTPVIPEEKDKVDDVDSTE